MRWLVVLAIVAGCGDDKHSRDYLSYTWDDRRVLCSDAIDDLVDTVNWSFIEDEIRQAGEQNWAMILHAHEPGTTVSTAAIERVLSDADAAGLATVGFSDLVPGPARGALALAFDDNWPDQWMTIRPILAAHSARVTFFITRWDELTDAQHAEIHQLFEDGHDIEPHTVHHLHATEYVDANGLVAYVNDEVMPSVQVLVDAGYHLTSFAYPFGDHSSAIDGALLERFDRVRTTPGECPW